ncbi:MAG: glycosyltransferase [Halioglobus sp.]|nr:glycosyltransferase [Halioglobus sp.]
MIRLNIVAWHNGGGLSRDIDIIISALPIARFRVTVNGFPYEEAKVRRRRILHRAHNVRLQWLPRQPLATAPYDINLFLEDISPSFFRQARVNVFIPNPEWFRKSQYRHLQRIDSVLCKTKSGQSIFEALGCPTRFISFTSDDRLDPAFSEQKQAGFLHLAGRSWQKGTKALTDLWQRHPEWPLLTVVQSPKTYSQSGVKLIRAPNIKHLLERPDNDSLRQLQNTYSIHLCPSEAEGFGHCIAEAMSCCAVTLTTDGAPMNELITRDRGILVAHCRTRKQRAGINYYVDRDDLQQKIEQIINMEQSSLQALGQNARKWYVQNDQLFRSQFIEALEATLLAS